MKGKFKLKIYFKINLIQPWNFYFSIDLNFGIDVVNIKLYNINDSDSIFGTIDELVRVKEKEESMENIRAY